jgi:cephalosporin hydroxylase
VNVPAPVWRRFFSEQDAPAVQQVIDNFHRLYYQLGPQGGTWSDTHWFGVRTRKCPLDLWIYQEIMYELRPDLIVETGTAYGGSALYLAHLCDHLGKGEIVTIDGASHASRPEHPRVEYLHAMSTDPGLVEYVGERASGNETVLVLLDSDHSRDHVLEELRLYTRFVTLGSYCVVEDSNMNGHPVIDGHGPGPWEAVEQFLQETDRFVIDASREKFMLTFSPSGYLKRVA